MTEKLIQCPACFSENLDNSVYCCQCGTPMRKGIAAKVPKRKQWVPIIVISLILTVILTSIIHLLTPSRSSQPVPYEQEKFTQKVNPAEQQEVEPVSPMFRSEKSPQTIKSTVQGSDEIGQLTVGNVSIVNPDGFTISEFPAVVVSGSWLALPSSVCIGGSKWFFRVDNNESVPIEGGLWGRGDAVGFWRLAGEKKYQGPEFATWKQEAPVRHLAIETGSLSEPLTLSSSGVQGSFIFSLVSESMEPGVFIQNGKVVGWSFGDDLEGAYMWPLGNDSEIAYTNYVDDFYNETFSGGREESLTAALTVGRDLSPQRQLQMFTDAFRLRPKLSQEKTPQFLKDETIYPVISKIVKSLMDQGAYHYVAPLVEERLLWETNDSDLLINVILATKNIYGVEAAINFIEVQGADIQQSLENGKTEFSQLHLELYLGWIKNFLDNGYIGRGRQVYNRARPQFGESTELHLLAVELALANQDWSEAESILYQREYTGKFRETAMLLSERISDLKGQENKIVIRFPAGSRDISVKAAVNETFDHDFLVDTGASFVTIPYSTVETLGLENELSQHQQEIQTAGGTVSARAVTLASIELQGWIVSDVKAFVMDLPERPGLGLLGLNFLNRFRMDLQADRGLLILEPK